LRRRALACVAKPAGPLEPADGSIAGFGEEKRRPNCRVAALWSSSPTFYSLRSASLFLCWLPPILPHAVTVWFCRRGGWLRGLVSAAVRGAIQRDY
jgi:hypothetical protein